MCVCVHVHVKRLIKLLHSYIYTGVHTQNVQIKIAFQQIQKLHFLDHIHTAIISLRIDKKTF